ncbi:MAG: phosphatase PAP2 family protein [Acidobacteriota bacterium]
MKQLVRVHVGVLSICLLYPCLCRAQAVDVGAAALPPPAFGAPADTFTAPPATRFWAPFRDAPRDFSRFFSRDTVHIVMAAGMAAALAHRADDAVKGQAMAHFSPTSASFRAGNIGGGFIAQTSAAVGAYAVGRLTGSARLSAVGGDLVRAQMLSQAVVQGVKFTTRRSRPDGDDRLSFPSGHTASSFATATVLQRHFGWKAGVPAYAFGGYVAAARISANRHHLSDVIMGAALGIAAGRTVTVGAGGHRFAVGVGPTAGGAAVTFTKRP